MRIFRQSRRFFASLLALALIVLIGTEPIRAQVVTVGGGGTWTGGAITTASSFLDAANFQIKNTADPTKILQFDVSGVTTGNTVTPFTLSGTAAAPVMIFANGTVGTPSIQTAGGGTSTGFWSRGSGATDVSGSGTWDMDWGNAAISMPSTASFGWAASTTATNAQDTILKRGGVAARVQLGTDLNGAAINQTFGACNGITGTDVAGCGLTLRSGVGTGAAVSNPLTINRQIVNATGTSAQTSIPAAVVCPTKILSNTSGVAQAVATITTTTTTAGAINWFYTSTASNGTVLDSDAAEILVAWNNNAGTVAATAGTGVGGAASAASGTLATTPTATVATNVVTLKMTPTWTVIVPTVVTGYSTFLANMATDTVVCQ